tara:strand:- start:114 stop:293 length:180 start_codon:yes stop_codon:yes gene_type:complete
MSRFRDDPAHLINMEPNREASKQFLPPLDTTRYADRTKDLLVQLVLTSKNSIHQSSSQI